MDDLLDGRLFNIRHINWGAQDLGGVVVIVEVEVHSRGGVPMSFRWTPFLGGRLF